MSSALKKLAYAAGTLLALIVLSLALMNGMPLSDALFRAAVVMFAGTVILAPVSYTHLTLPTNREV